MNTVNTSFSLHSGLSVWTLRVQLCLQGLFLGTLPPTVQRLASKVNWQLQLVCECVNVSVDGYLSLCVVSVINWRLVRGVACLCPKMHLLLSTIVCCGRLLPRVQKMGICLLNNCNWILVYKCGDKCVQPPDHHLKMFMLVTLIHWFKIKHKTFLWFWISSLLHYQILAKLRVHRFMHKFMYEKSRIHSVINWWTISHSHGFRNFKPDFMMAHHIN